MDNFDPYNVLLSIATNIPVLLMTAFVLQGHICSAVFRIHVTLCVESYTSHLAPKLLIFFSCASSLLGGTCYTELGLAKCRNVIIVC